ncbi:MAG: cysteine desulfurase family protein [Oscillospiraceae bacterium]|jgi:cysteine desulfurase
MTEGIHYLDNAATTPVSRKSAAAAQEILAQEFGNPSSLYGLGISASKRLEKARAEIAEEMGCLPEELYFTGCGTESNNLAIIGAARARKHWGRKIVVTGYEHPSVQNTVNSLRNEGFEVTEVMPEDGKVDPSRILAEVGPDTALVAAMYVNNETGAMIDVPSLAEEVKKINRRTAVHCDCVQGFMKQKFSFGSVDTASASGHKINAPKGVGLLYVRRGFNLERVQFGGGQERGLRSGTENVAFACALAEAVKEHSDIDGNLGKIKKLRDRLAEGLKSFENVRINSPADASPYVLNFSFLGYRSETVLHFLEERNVYVSSGSACSKGEKSHTLEAMKLPDAAVDSAVRVSFGLQNTEDDVDALLSGLREASEILVRAR